VLFLLLPLSVYFTFGRRAALAVGLGCVGLVMAILQTTVPDWYRTVEPVSDVLMFTVGLVLTIAMASVAVGEQRARARLEKYAARVAELSASAERNRLARDIHDSLGHHLTVITILLEKAMTFREHDVAAADLALVHAQDAARRALDDVRRSVRTLRAETAPFRLASALDDLVRAADDGRPAITLRCAGDESRYDSAALTALYRAAQEALTNARRHSGADRVAITVHCEKSRARLVVTDDGRGFSPEREGFGLLGMRERVDLAGGSVDIYSRPGAGTRLTVTIPHRAAA
jgi:signal transduction histidine kinase